MATALDLSSPEYATLEEMFSALVDNLAANADAIDSLNNDLFASGLISEEVFNTVQYPDSGATLHDRCSSMLTPVLEKVKNDPICFHSLIGFLQKASVWLCDIVFELEEKLQSKQELGENQEDSDNEIDSTYGYYTESNISDNDDKGHMNSSSATPSASDDEVLHSQPFPFVQLPPKLTYALIRKMLEEGLESASEMIANQGDNDTQSSALALQQFSEQLSYVQSKFLKKKSSTFNDKQKNKKIKKSSNDSLNCDVLIHNFMKGNYDLALSSLLGVTDSDSACLKTITSSQKDNKKNLLHYAALHGWIDIMNKLIDDHGFNPMSTDVNGETAVHHAAWAKKSEAFEVLVTKYQCNPVCKGLLGQTPLFIATKLGCLDIIKCYMTSLILDYDGNTICNGKPLGIVAAEYGQLHILKYLIEECHFDVSKKCSENNSALDFAARSGNFFIVNYLIENHKCDPSQEKDWYSMKPLHHASEKGHIHIVEYLISECDCNVHDTAKGLSPLQYAAGNGHFELVRYFVLEYNCNPEPALRHAGSLEIIKFLSEKSDKNPDYKVSLANAIKGKHIDAVKYLVDKWGKDTDLSDQLFEATRNHNIQAVKFLIDECQVNEKSIDSRGRTLLHYAAEGEYTKNKELVLQYLLAAGLDPLKKDKEGDTALDIASRGYMTKTIFDIFGETKTTYPVDSYVNILIVGNSGAGKSTLSKVIEKTTDDSYKEITDVNPDEVEPLTAGIVPITLDHKQLRNIVLHDFAGHSEYHLSHTAVIENILEGAAAVIIIVVDVSNSDYLIHLKQWLAVVRNEIQKAKYDCHIIIVASHVDRLSSNVEKKKIIQKLKSELNDGDKIEDLDCRKLCGEKLDSFFLKVQNACSSIRDNDKRSLTLYCHIMYNLLQSSKNEVLTLSDIVDDQLGNNNFFLPYDAKQILNILSSLHSTGLIYYLNCEDIDHENVFYLGYDYNDHVIYNKITHDCKIWVVKNKMKFLKKVNGIIFSDEILENSEISETGIITVPFLKTLFPDEDLIMVISFLESMGLCHIVSPIFLHRTNLMKKDQIGKEDVLFLFFPSLVKLERPPKFNDDVFRFGWFLECTKDDELFSQRFFNSLTLHLTLKHAPEEAAGTVYHTRQCNYWKNGVEWGNKNGILTSVELVNDNRCVLILMSCDEGDEELMILLRRTIIKDVWNICKKYCPTLEVEKFVIDPDCLKSYPIEKPRETTAYCVENIRNRKESSDVVYPTYPRNPISKLKGKRVREILPDEPDSDNLSIYGEEERTYGVNSINLIVGALQQNHFPDRYWKKLGRQLGLDNSTLDDIKVNYGTLRERFKECLHTWLKRQDSTKQDELWKTLVEALNKMGQKSVAESISTAYLTTTVPFYMPDHDNLGEAKQYCDVRTQTSDNNGQEVLVGSSVAAEPAERVSEEVTSSTVPEVAYRVMSECISTIKKWKIELRFFAEKLLEKRIINEGQRNTAIDEHSGRTYDQRMDQLLDIVKYSVQQEGKVFDYILEILKDVNTILADKLRDDMIDKYEQYNKQLL